MTVISWPLSGDKQVEIIEAFNSTSKYPDDLLNIDNLYFSLNFINSHTYKYISWILVGCFGFNGPLRQYFSLYRAVSQREGERGENG